eukprot:CAMPEP_0185483750 /NCGR_PEP_ID=MMETSP1366-20130426/8786_1 /TAXON_ID=38817 /ORGANISM="Gephyrocapsa oceanica, Strain RCC1303" /LENGTH=113 /DNA_ID=CAMNT_0028091725 /DNA_START=20 /DNA_END=358 /DNA_ORIENTATION=-
MKTRNPTYSLSTVRMLWLAGRKRSNDWRIQKGRGPPLLQRTSGGKGWARERRNPSQQAPQRSAATAPATTAPTTNAASGLLPPRPPASKPPRPRAAASALRTAAARRPLQPPR